MRNPYIQTLTKFMANDKMAINAVYKAAMLASQESFYRAYQSGDDIVFEILEGQVEYDLASKTGLFRPNKVLANLLEGSEYNNSFVLLDNNLNRFTTILREAYRDFNKLDLTNPFNVWVMNGNKDGTKKEFLNWVLRKCEEDYAKKE